MNDQTSLVASKPDQLPAAQTQGAALVTAQSREIAQQQALFAMAQRFPRDLDIFREKILKECKNATFAELAIYDLPFGKEHVRGGSIRLAEGIYRAMQWFALDVRMVGDTPSMPRFWCSFISAMKVPKAGEGSASLEISAAVFGMMKAVNAQKPTSTMSALRAVFAQAETASVRNRNTAA